MKRRKRITEVKRIFEAKTKKYQSSFSDDCSWESVGQLALPTWVHFNDYSAVSIKHKRPIDLPTNIAVTSQEMGQVWIGRIAEIDRAPYFSLSSLQNQVTYDLPKTSAGGSRCVMSYCNLEGVTWRGENQLVFASDKAKNDQDDVCTEKEQSIHYLDLPASLSN